MTQLAFIMYEALAPSRNLISHRQSVFIGGVAARVFRSSHSTALTRTVSCRPAVAAQVLVHKCAAPSWAASPLLNYPALAEPKTPQPPAAAAAAANLDEPVVKSCIIQRWSATFPSLQRSHF